MPRFYKHPCNATPRLPTTPLHSEPSTFRGSQGTSVLGLFGMTLAATGASEKTLKRIKRDYKKVLCLCARVLCVREIDRGREACCILTATVPTPVSNYHVCSPHPTPRTGPGVPAHQQPRRLLPGRQAD